jgi:Holliday junction resolvasome RuvABC endonuclease subunit
MVKILQMINPKPTTIMSIDASTNSLAFAIFSNNSLSSFGKINFKGLTTYEKVIDACRKTSEFLKNYKEIDAIVIEHTVFMNSPKTAADLALVQGALLGAAGTVGIKKIRSVSPMTWQSYIENKKLTTKEKQDIRAEFPDKSASWYKTYERELRKQRTINFISTYYDKQILDNDVADACAIGHYAIHNWDRLTK